MERALRLISANAKLLRQLRTGWGNRVGAGWSGAAVDINRAFAWHEDTAVIAWWRANLGTVLGWLTPMRRRFLLAMAAVLVGVPQLFRATLPLSGSPSHTDAAASALAVTAVVALLGLCYVASAHFGSLPAVVRRHPQLALHGFFWGLLLILWNTASADPAWRHVLVGVALILPLLLWRMGYLLLAGQRGKVSRTPFTDHLIYLLPLQVGWFAFLPFGKGLDYLSRHEARDEYALARSQLAGIKLILLALLWYVMLAILHALLYGSSNWVHRTLGGPGAAYLPAFGELLAQGGDAPLWQSWLGIYVELVRRALQVAILGHGIVGVFRLLGFNIFRNTYKPLLAETVSQFWARLEFYYKELLVDFFFLPTFAKWFRKWPALRMFAAVFAAAVVGNMYCHLIDLDRGVLVLHDFQAVWSHHSRLFYCLLLAIGIFVSMQREQRRGGQAPRAGFCRRVGRIVGVWTFFALIRIWDHFPEVSFVTRTQFFFGLFGLA